MGVGVVGLLCGGFLLLVFVFKGNLSQSQLIPVVDRPCLALVRQCRKKNESRISFSGSVTCHRKFCDGDKLEQESLKKMAMAHFKS